MIRALTALEKREGANEDQTIGIRILARSMEEALRQIVQNAASVAGLLLTTEVMIAEASKDEPDHVHPSADGGMGGMGM